MIGDRAIMLSNKIYTLRIVGFLLPCTKSHFRSRTTPCPFPFPLNSCWKVAMGNSNFRCRPLYCGTMLSQVVPLHAGRFVPSCLTINNSIIFLRSPCLCRCRQIERKQFEADGMCHGVLRDDVSLSSWLRHELQTATCLRDGAGNTLRAGTAVKHGVVKWHVYSTKQGRLPI